MSSSNPDPERPSLQERRLSVGKYVKRLRTVLKKDKTSRTSASTASGSSRGTAGSNPAAPTSAPSSSSQPEAKGLPPGSYLRSQAQQERARKLFEKYGLTLEPHEWMTTGATTANIQRVEKPIRMRVHRTCHRCQTTFGADRICAKCEHKRCKKCPRYPAKKPKDGREKAKAKEPGPIAVDEHAKPSDEGLVLPPFYSVKSRQFVVVKSRTNELVEKPIKQRVRRTCHKCDTVFKPHTAPNCAKCGHQRCTACPRDPPKLKKWPHGYPGDVPEDEADLPTIERTWRKPRQRVRWTCDQCSATFTEGKKTCGGCGHQRCDSCVRIPPKKVKKEPDPEVVKSVEAKLAALKLSDGPAATTAAAAA